MTFRFLRNKKIRSDEPDIAPIVSFLYSHLSKGLPPMVAGQLSIAIVRNEIETLSTLIVVDRIVLERLQLLDDYVAAVGAVSRRLRSMFLWLMVGASVNVVIAISLGIWVMILLR